MSKRLVAVFLSILILILIVGIWLLFPLLQGFYRFKAQQTIQYQPCELVTLHLKLSEFKRVGNDEIEFKNIRYDIKKEQLVKDIYEFSTYPDYLETQLLAFFGEAWQSLTEVSETHSPVSQLIRKILSIDCFLQWSSFDFAHIFLKNSVPSFSFLLPSFWAYSVIMSPPPEV